MVTDSGDLDPDHHFYNSNTNQACNYLLVDDFNLKYHEYKDNNHFSLIHINARSLSKNFEEISNYLSLLNHEFSVIGISETWLTNSTSDNLICQTLSLFHVAVINAKVEELVSM